MTNQRHNLIDAHIANRLDLYTRKIMTSELDHYVVERLSGQVSDLVLEAVARPIKEQLPWRLP